MTIQEIENPTDKYPKPPYKKQSQPWPGLASKMDPRPDHGETSYKGSGRLAGRKALITGGDSGMGRAAAIAYAREGADVAINYFPTEEPDAKEVIDLIQAEGRMSSTSAGARLAGLFSPFNILDGIRIWLGGPSPGEDANPGHFGPLYGVVGVLLLAACLGGLAARYRKVSRA